MKIYDLENEPSSLQIAHKIIQSDGVIAFPTDTIYGLCVGFTVTAITKLHEIRKRPLSKPFLLTLPESYSLESLTQKLSLDQKKMIEEYWPGKITVLLPKNNDLFYPSGKSIALRKPDKKDSIYFYQLLSRLRHPLLSTSINLPGKNTVDEPTKIDEMFSGKIDAYFRLPHCIRTKPSQIWNLTVWPYRRIR